MNSIFARTFLSIVFVLFIFTLLIIFIQITGFNRSIKEWEQNKMSSSKEMINRIIEDNYKDDFFSFEELNIALQNVITGNTIIVIYDNNKNPLYQILQGGMRRRHAMMFNTNNLIVSEFIPIHYNKELKGFFRISFLSYKNEEGNQKILLTIKSTFIAGILLAFGAAIIFAFYFSKMLSAHSKKAAYAIEEISRGNLDVVITESSLKEISIITESAKILKEKLKKEKALRDQWALDIAHDLRTPVTAVKTQLEAVLDKALVLNDDRIKKILGETNKVEILINELAELTNLESPELKLNTERIRAGVFFSEIENTFHLKMKEKKIGFKVENTLREIAVDRKLFLRALTNIVDNAVKFTPGSGEIEISAYSKNGQAEIKIKNSGTFIIESEIDKIFDRLYRSEYARNTKGFGLGLSITKKIIELHGGSIRAESSKENGTVFIIFLKTV